MAIFRITEQGFIFLISLRTERLAFPATIRNYLKPALSSFALLLHEATYRKAG